MKLHDYFQEQKKTTVSEAQKFSIYQKIMEQKSQKSHLRRKSLLHVKSLAYGLTLTALFVSLYGNFFLPEKVNLDGNLIVQPHNIKGVDADYIANIVNFEGDFFIEHNGQQLQTSSIHDNDTVTLGENTNMIFHMDESTQAQVVGPAKFVLHKNEDGYKLELSYGDFVEIQSLEDTQTQNIEIETDGIVVHQQKSDVSTSFQLIADTNGHVVKNQGKSTISIITDNNQQTEITESQLANIQADDITLLSIEEFDEAIQDKKISQTFTRKHDDQQVEEEEILVSHTLTGIQLSGILASTGVVDEEVAEELGISNANSQLLSLEDNNKIHSLLEKSFLEKNIQELYIYATQQSSNEFTIVYNNLENKIQQLYQIFDLSYTASRGNFNTLQNNISVLHQHMTEQEYMIPPSYLQNLLEINHGIQLILQLDLSKELTIDGWEIVLSQLRFQ